jgi:hypothetical protein
MHAQEEAVCLPVTLCRQKLGEIAYFRWERPLSASTPSAKESVSAATNSFFDGYIHHFKLGLV